jgi:hypothetical protein
MLFRAEILLSREERQLPPFPEAINLDESDSPQPIQLLLEGGASIRGIGVGRR